MKKLIFALLAGILLSCSKDSGDSPNELEHKVFHGVAYAICSTNQIISLSPDEYEMMSFENDLYQPKPNTWYRTSTMWTKTGSDVSPKYSIASFDYLPVEYTSPCR